MLNFSFEVLLQDRVSIKYRKMQLEWFKTIICTFPLLTEEIYSSEIACNLSNSCYNQQVRLSVIATGYLKTE